MFAPDTSLPRALQDGDVLQNGAPRRYIPSWQGERAAPRCIPPAEWHSRHRAGSRHSNVVAVASPVRGAFLLPRHPHDQGRFRRSLGTHRARGDFGSPPCIAHRPMGFRAPWNPRPTLRGLDARQRLAVGSRPAETSVSVSSCRDSRYRRRAQCQRRRFQTEIC